MIAFGAMAGVKVVNPETGSLENRVATMAAQAIEGWRARGLDGTVPVPGGGEMPARFAAGIMPVEFLLHAWDMAQGSGTPLVVSDEVVAYVHKLAEQLVPGARGSSFSRRGRPVHGCRPDGAAGRFRRPSSRGCMTGSDDADAQAHRRRQAVLPLRSSPTRRGSRSSRCSATSARS